MATKNNPGRFDCWSNAHPDEPMFILLGRDGHAPNLVRRWARKREAEGEDAGKVAEARECAHAMDKWSLKLGKPIHERNIEEPRALDELEPDSHVIREPTCAGGYRLSPGKTGGIVYQFEIKPNAWHRFWCRVLLGWRWEDT